MSIDTFRSRVQSHIRALYSGGIGLGKFVSDMKSDINSHYRDAWTSGALECGIGSDERSEEELSRLSDLIRENQSYVERFGNEIVAGREKPLVGFVKRADLWANKWNEVKSESQLMACADQKLQWVWSPEKEHCSDCRKMNGRVYRAKVWEKYRVRPQLRSLGCGGWRCGCRLVPAPKKKITVGQPPKIRGN